MHPPLTATTKYWVLLALDIRICDDDLQNSFTGLLFFESALLHPTTNTLDSFPLPTRHYSNFNATIFAQVIPWSTLVSKPTLLQRSSTLLCCKWIVCINPRTLLHRQKQRQCLVGERRSVDHSLQATLLFKGRHLSMLHHQWAKNWKSTRRRASHGPLQPPRIERELRSRAHQICCAFSWFRFRKKCPETISYNSPVSINRITAEERYDSVFSLPSESHKRQRETAKARWIDPRSIDRMTTEVKYDSAVYLLYESPMREREPAEASWPSIDPRSIHRMTADDKYDSVVSLLSESSKRDRERRTGWAQSISASAQT